MSRRSGGLGRGIGALIPPELVRSSGSDLRDLPVTSIEPNRYQPRHQFDEDSLVALSESIRVVGVLQPILVRPLDDDRFELIAGERRWRAARRAGLSTVPAIVRVVEELASLEQALVENVHRQDLTPLEEAAAYQQLMEDFGLTQEAVAGRVGKSRSAVANTLRLFHLPPNIQGMLRDRRLSAGHARALLGTPDRAFQEALAQRICAEGLSVRQAEETVRRRAELEAKLGVSGPGERMVAAAAPPPAMASSGDPDGGQVPGPGVPAEVAVAGDRPRLPSAPPALERTPDLPPAGLVELEQLLGEHLDTAVQVTMGRDRGRITITFADLEDLERIYRLMAGGGPST